MGRHRFWITLEKIHLFRLALGKVGNLGFQQLDFFDEQILDGPGDRPALLHSPAKVYVFPFLPSIDLGQDQLGLKGLNRILGSLPTDDVDFYLGPRFVTIGPNHRRQTKPNGLGVEVDPMKSQGQFGDMVG